MKLSGKTLWQKVSLNSNFIHKNHSQVSKLPPHITLWDNNSHLGEKLNNLAGRKYTFPLKYDRYT